jgi:cytochrome oxidase assembly protein ShyY1
MTQPQEGTIIVLNRGFVADNRRTDAKNSVTIYSGIGFVTTTVRDLQKKKKPQE